MKRRKRRAGAKIVDREKRDITELTPFENWARGAEDRSFGQGPSGNEPVIV